MPEEVGEDELLEVATGFPEIQKVLSALSSFLVANRTEGASFIPEA